MLVLLVLVLLERYEELLLTTRSSYELRRAPISTEETFMQIIAFIAFIT